MNDNILILGGGYGGALAAARIARRGVPVTLIDLGPGFTERIRLHQVAAGDDIDPIPYERLFRKLPVEVIRARVLSIDRAQKSVLTTRGAVRYDRLIYALGSSSTTPEHAVSVGNPTSIRSRLAHARSAIVVGGGLTGIETTAEIAERHPHIGMALIDGETIGKNLSPRARTHLRDWFDGHGVTLFDRTRVTAVVEGGVILESGQRLEADLVIWCGPFALSPIARDAGLEVNARWQIVVDGFLRSSDPSIYAIGDAAISGSRRMSCALALPMGAYVADVVCGATREPFRFGFAGVCISLGRSDGIIQLVHADDTPRDTAITGRPGAWMKELICRYALLSVRLESHGVHYSWPKPAEAA
jgi:NADH dehydrogenase FAD-containing subunit